MRDRLAGIHLQARLPESSHDRDEARVKFFHSAFLTRTHSDQEFQETSIVLGTTRGRVKLLHSAFLTCPRSDQERQETLDIIGSSLGNRRDPRQDQVKSVLCVWELDQDRGRTGTQQCPVQASHSRGQVKEIVSTMQQQGRWTVRPHMMHR